jgi:hypothetical protein
VRLVRDALRRFIAQLTARRLAVAFVALAMLLGARPTAGLAASTPSPSAGRLPGAAAHAEFIVETNRKGQVSRVRSAKRSSDPVFDVMSYENALQAFIRTDSGEAVAGVFRLSYDYNPATRRVRREVALVRAGGVDPNALGVVDQMAALDRKARAAKQSPKP